VGHLQVVTGLLDQLYGNAWGDDREFWGRVGGSRSHYNSGYHGPGGFPDGPLTTNGSPTEQTQGHGTHCYNEILTCATPPELPKNAPHIPV